MQVRRLGRQTVTFGEPVGVVSWASVVGRMEGSGPLGGSFDLVNEDSFFGQATWEQAEARMQAEALELVERCCAGGPLTEREKTRIPAQREPFAACYTALERQLKRTGAESAPELPLLRLLAAESGGSDGFLRAAMALRVFRERGLIQITEGEDGFLTLRLSRPAGKVDLFACPYLRRLKSPNPNGRE